MHNGSREDHRTRQITSYVFLPRMHNKFLHYLAKRRNTKIASFHSNAAGLIYSVLLLATHTYAAV